MTSLLPLLAQIGFWLIEQYFTRSKITDERRKAYMEMIMIRDRLGLSTVKMRLKAEDQMERINQKWAEIEKAERETRNEIL